MNKSISIAKHHPSIFQGRLVFPAPRGMSLTMEHPLERVAFRSLGIALAVLTCLYLYFVSASVLNVIAREETNVQTARLATNVSGLESQFFNESASVRPAQDAASLGLVPVAHTAYVYRPGNAASASVPAVPSNEI